MPACTNESLAKLWPPPTRTTFIKSNGEISPRASPPGGGNLQKPLAVLRRLPSAQSGSWPGIRSPPPPNSIDERPLRGPLLLIRFAWNIFLTLFYLGWSQLFLIGPTLCLSAWLWCFWKCIQIPLSIFKRVLMILHTPTSELIRKKRTVILSGGTSVQTIHLARNFYSAGARVVVLELEGYFSLAKFSTAVDRFYTVPSPVTSTPYDYVNALCKIVAQEKASCYVPVCGSSNAYYDALAKPKLEELGCTCFCPGLKEVYVLDDMLELLPRCHSAGLTTPRYYSVLSQEELHRLYDCGLLSQGVYTLASAGTQGCRRRYKHALPASKCQLKSLPELNTKWPCVVVHEPPGEQVITCTTVKNWGVAANVTCRVQPGSRGLMPVRRPQVDRWLQKFFSRVNIDPSTCGHISFRLIICQMTGEVIPVGCNIGVTIPYICYTSVQSRVVSKPCPHFNPTISGPLIASASRYWMHEVVLKCLSRPGPSNIYELITTVLDGDMREVLFEFWDPLPYCAYYHLQVPLRVLTNITEWPVKLVRKKLSFC